MKNSTIVTRPYEERLNDALCLGLSYAVYKLAFWGCFIAACGVIGSMILLATGEIPTRGGEATLDQYFDSFVVGLPIGVAVLLIYKAVYAIVRYLDRRAEQKAMDVREWDREL